MADTTTPVTTAAPSSSDSVLDLASQIMGSSTAKGAALGALMSHLLSQVSEPGGVVQPMDMSKFGVPARTTTINPMNYVPYSQYATRDTTASMSPEMTRAFGAPSGLGNLQPASFYSQAPSFFANRQPFSITSAGSGESRMPTLSITPKNTNKISPLTGTLLGAAAGYLAPSTSGSTAAGNTSASALNALLKKAAGLFKGSGSGYTDVVPSENLGSQDSGIPVNPDLYGGGSEDTTNWDDWGTDTTDSSGSTAGLYDPDTVTDYSSSTAGLYDPDTVTGFANGGMAVPLMADGGQASYYTYGTPVDPMQVMQQMQQMAHGGRPHGGLHVPTVEGRHDYRAGSRVMGPGDGQSDDIPAMLADGEYVIDAETVAQLGNGSSKAGSDMLDKFREEIRGHKRSAPVNKIPPASKSPLQYLKQAQSRSKKNG